ncbi:EspF repeat-containing protein [Escherichia coli]|uniref:EspF repeat-containing protein n=1 Tax=Escherichia coli TaxID=562 RepID=UPI0039A3D34D
MKATSYSRPLPDVAQRLMQHPDLSEAAVRLEALWEANRQDNNHHTQNTVSWRFLSPA